MRLADLETVRDTPHPEYSYLEELGVFVHPLLAPVVKEIRTELATETYKDRPHGRCSTNNAGCSGPLCRYARREWWQDNYRRKRERQGKTYTRQYNPAHDFTRPLFRLFIERIDAEWERKLLAAELEKLLTRGARRQKELSDRTTDSGPVATGGLPGRNSSDRTYSATPAPLMVPVLV